MNTKVSTRIIAAALLFGTLYLLVLGGLPRFDYGAPGTRDFVQYWAACRVAAAGGSPYDPQALFTVQQAVGLSWHQPVMMWNPPWSLPLLCPLARLDFSAAAKLWLLGNAALLISSALLTWRTFFPQVRDLRLAIWCAFLFIPALDCLDSGQLGIVFGFSIAAFVRLTAGARPFAAGLALAPLWLKPYLFHLLFTLLLVHAARARSVKLLSGLVTAPLCLGLLALLLYPESFSQWWSALRAEKLALPVTSVWEWRSDALSSEIRAFLREWTLPDRWPALAVPLCAQLLVLARLRAGEALEREALWVVALSIFSAPYAWFSDQAALVALQVGSAALIERYYELERRGMLVALIALQVVLALSHIYWRTFWYPALVAYLWTGLLAREKRWHASSSPSAIPRC